MSSSEGFSLPSLVDENGTEAEATHMVRPPNNACLARDESMFGVDIRSGTSSQNVQPSCSGLSTMEKERTMAVNTSSTPDPENLARWIKRNKDETRQRLHHWLHENPTVEHWHGLHLASPSLKLEFELAGLGHWTFDQADAHQLNPIIHVERHHDQEVDKPTSITISVSENPERELVVQKGRRQCTLRRLLRGLRCI